HLGALKVTGGPRCRRRRSAAATAIGTFQLDQSPDDSRQAGPCGPACRRGQASKDQLPVAAVADPAAVATPVVPPAAVVATVAPAHVLDGALILGVAAPPVSRAGRGRRLCRCCPHHARGAP